MEAEGWPGRASSLDQGRVLLQLWGVGLEGAHGLLHHCLLSLQRLHQQRGIRRPKPLLRSALECGHGHPRHHLYRTVWLWACRPHPAHCRLARRVGVLEHSAHRQGSPGFTLAAREGLQTHSIFLVRLHEHVRLRMVSRLYLAVAQLRLYSCKQYSVTILGDGA